MKKNVLTFIFAVSSLIFSSQLSAQETPLSVGFKAGAGLSNYRLRGDMKSLKSKMSFGGSVGGFIKYDLSSNFAIQSGIEIYYNTSKLESPTNRSSDKLKSLGVEVPVYGIVQGELGNGKAFIGAGGYAGYGISTKLDGVNLYKKNNGTGTTMNRFDYGLAAIIGYDFSKSWQINASYKFGLADLHKGMGGSMKNQGVSIGIGYKF
ncbi:outer membrane beta-barrel protein [Sphingobacterium sp. SGR-19]|uniref:outer membrane beta-barrel protein n=1 Tax=Sphingobacterium sp. SGR-19 TaxID=2710886 RepID=UPI0013EB2169|nr:outer membrane beta-barrel protein [Sphingobacterium sp. SGR-19]NGM65066.1 porin family protein [Sphingobacterium sp. SGR-19]